MGAEDAELVARLTAARPTVLGALLRYFRDLDLAEDAFQEACLRALRTWPDKGLPKEPVAWLTFVGRNFGIDQRRRQSRLQALPGEETLSELEDAEARRVDLLERGEFRDDVLRLLFVCCHPELPVAHQIALALKIVAGLSVPEIARAFLVKVKTMEQRLTRAKRRVAGSGTRFSAPSRTERSRRLRAVATMIYLLFNEGYSASHGEAPLREPLCQEAIRLARLLLRLFPREPEIMALLALCLLQHSRARARLDEAGSLVLLKEQDRSLWDGRLIAEGRVLVEKALRRRQVGPLQLQAAIAAVHSQAVTAAETNWDEIDRLYAVLERIEGSPVVTLNRAVAVSKARGAAAALAMIEPCTAALSGYFHFHGVRGGLLAELGRRDEAAAEWTRAVDLARTTAEADHLRMRLRELEGGS